MLHIYSAMADSTKEQIAPVKIFPLTIGLNPSPYTQALFDGTVRAKGSVSFQVECETSTDMNGSRTIIPKRAPRTSLLLATQISIR